MDYSRNYFSVSALTLFILTALCSGAPQLNTQDVSKETEVFDKTELMHSMSSSSSSTTSEGDVIITASAEATAEQILSSEDTPVVPSNTLPEKQETESSSLSTSGSKTESAPTSSESHDESTVSNTETKPNDESEPPTKPSTKKPSTSPPGSEKPESSSSSHKHNGASTVVPLNIFGLFLIAFVSRALLLKA